MLSEEIKRNLDEILKNGRFAFIDKYIHNILVCLLKVEKLESTISELSKINTELECQLNEVNIKLIQNEDDCK